MLINHFHHTYQALTTSERRQVDGVDARFRLAHLRVTDAGLPLSAAPEQSWQRSLEALCWSFVDGDHPEEEALWEAGPYSGTELFAGTLGRRVEILHNDLSLPEVLRHVLRELFPPLLHMTQPDYVKAEGALSRFELVWRGQERHLLLERHHMRWSASWRGDLEVLWRPEPQEWSPPALIRAGRSRLKTTPAHLIYAAHYDTGLQSFGGLTKA